MQTIDLGRRLAAEGLGIAALLATVVGSGIMGEQLAGGNVALALLGNTLATGAILAVLILIFGPVSAPISTPPSRCRSPCGGRFRRPTRWLTWRCR